MSYDIPTLMVFLIILIVLSAFFSGSEIGMMSLNRYRLRHLVKKGNKNAKRVSEMLSKPDRLLSVVLIGNTVANILASMIATLIGQELYGEVGVLIATLVLSFIIIIFAEMIPKTFAAIEPQRVAFLTAFPLKIFQHLFMPLVACMSFLTNITLRLFGITETSLHKESLTGEELRSVVHEAGGLMPVEHKSMLISLIDLEEAVVEDIMIPKADLIGIDLTRPWRDVLDQLETAQHTRLPVYYESIDNLCGMLHVRDVLNLSIEKKLNLTTLKSITEPPYFVPEGTRLNTQILNFRKIKKRSAFVVNEYGDLIGLVTMEDILEEVVGEFTTDVADLSRDITPQADGSSIVDASITLRQLNRLMNWKLPLIGPKTLSGLIIEYLGVIPSSECCLVIDHYRIEVLRVSENMIRSVKMTKCPKRSQRREES